MGTHLQGLLERLTLPVPIITHFQDARVGGITVEQGLHNLIDPADNRPDGSNTSMNHENGTRRATQPGKISGQGRFFPVCRR